MIVSHSPALLQVTLINNGQDLYLENYSRLIGPLGSRSTCFNWRQALSTGELVDYKEPTGEWTLRRVVSTKEILTNQTGVIKYLSISPVTDELRRNTRGSEATFSPFAPTGRSKSLNESPTVEILAHSPLIQRPNTYSVKKHQYSWDFH